MYLCLGLTATPAPGVVLFQLESFDSPSAWSAGNPHPTPPVIRANAGPTGGGDSSLEISARPGSGAGSRLAAFERDLWTGDYLGAGVHQLTMDLRNDSLPESIIRLGLNGPGGWFVTEAVTLPRFSPWTPAAFDLQPGALLSAGGTDATATLGEVTELRILHNPDVSFRGAEGQRLVFVDNIRAVPEPSTTALLLLGLVFLRKRNR